MSSLYEIENQYLAVARAIKSDDEELLNDTLDSIDFHTDFENKMIGYAKVVENFKSDINDLKNEENRLKERRKHLENKVSRLEGAMLDGMVLTKTKSIDNPLFTIKLRTNKRVSITDKDKISKEYLVPQEPKVSKTEIRKALKNGKTVDGAKLTEYESINIK